MKRHTLLLAPLLFPVAIIAQDHLQLDAGFTNSNSNLFTQQTPASQAGNPTEQRLGLQLSLTTHWQKITNSDGLTALAYLYQDWALTNKNSDIQQLSFQGQKLFALNPNWLSRTQINSNYYDNQQRPANSYQSLGINQTLGYFANNNSGWDLSFAIQQRSYPQNPTGSYQGQQFELGSVYYFSSPLSKPRWATAITLQQFNASDTFYNSLSQQLNLSYGQWHWQKLQGNVSLQWIKNRYPNTNAQLSETYSLFSLDTHYPLTPQWRLTTTLNGGSYQTSINTTRGILTMYIGLQTEL